MKHMIIDIGSNSVKYEVFESESNDFCNFIKIDHRSTVMGFLSYLNNGRLTETGFSVLCDILSDYKKCGESLGCDNVSAFATASFRSCSDPMELIERIEKELGLKIELFSGQTEGEMSFLGMLHSHREAVNGVMFDMGGGSTEVNVFENKESVFLKSLPMGALSLKNAFSNHSGDPLDKKSFATPKELEDIYNHALKTAREFDLPQNVGKHAYMVGGSAQFIGILCSKPDEDGIVRFSKDKMKEIIKLYSEIDEEKADYLIKTLPKRHLLIIPAATAFLAIFDYMGIEQLTISKGGIREGYMKYLLSKKASN